MAGAAANAVGAKLADALNALGTPPNGDGAPPVGAPKSVGCAEATAGDAVDMNGVD